MVPAFLLESLHRTGGCAIFVIRMFEKMNRGKILVVDDNQGILTTLNILLPKYFAEVHLIPSPKVIYEEMREFCPDVILLDMNFHTSANTGNEGLFWLSEIKRRSPQTEVVLFTAYGDITLAVEGMKRGAFDFIVKPFENEKLITTLAAAVDRTLQTGKSQRGNEEKHKSVSMFWGSGQKMKAIHHTVGKIAPTDASVLITGENGTGKDVLAAEIHRLSDRFMKQMVCVDAGAITETLFESELFGHVKGAFTDASTDRAGKIEEADGGTLFLDEIGNIPLHLQAKLLRVLQNRCITRVGDTKSVPVDIRLICATNKNIEEMVQEGKFREDLYYRINTIHIELPALRERQEDIIPLAGIFLNRYAEKYHRDVKGFTEEARQVLMRCGWHGNIRELQNCIEKAVILADSSFLQAKDFNLPLSEMSEPEADEPEETLEMAEERAIRIAMDHCQGNLTQVAKTLNISRPTLYAKLKKYNI